MTREEAMKREEARQAQILCDAIQKAIDETGSQFEAPMINALAGALVSVQGHMLAAVPKQHRKAMKDAMIKRLPRAIAASKGRAGTAQTVTVGGKLQ